MGRVLEYYDYLFYKFYRWSEHIEPDGPHAITATSMLSLTVGINLALLQAIVIGEINRTALLAAGVAVFVVNLWRYWRCDRYKSFIGKFNAETPVTRRKGNLVAMVVFLGTPAVFAVVTFLVLSPRG